jgi:hypothetical protein
MAAPDLYAGIDGSDHRFYSPINDTYSTSPTPPTQDTLDYTNSVTKYIGAAANGIKNYAVLGTNLVMKATQMLPTSISSFAKDPLAILNTDYTKAAASKLGDELAGKMNLSGLGDKFKNLSTKETLDTVGGMRAIRNVDNGLIAGIMGPAEEKGGVPSNLIQQDEIDRTSKFKVSISQQPTNDSYSEVIFDVMPTINEGRTASYDAFAPLHAAGEILRFKNTANRTWSISAKLISRTISEATINMIRLNTIRGWTMPYYGQGTAMNPNTSEYLGAPPPILTLKAYGDRMIGPVKCVLESYSWEFPNDVDYIQTAYQEPFPVILSVSLQLKEAWSPAELSNFDIMQYRSGNLPATYAKAEQPDQESISGPANAGGAMGGRGGQGGTTANEMLDNARSQAISATSQQINAASDIRKLDIASMGDITSFGDKMLVGARNLAKSINLTPSNIEKL